MNNLHKNHLVLVHPSQRKNSQFTIGQKIQAFWTSFGLKRNQLSLDPEILKGGRGWWYAYESTTDQLIYLESEKDIDMWLDESFRQSSIH